MRRSSVTCGWLMVLYGHSRFLHYLKLTFPNPLFSTFIASLLYWQILGMHVKPLWRRSMAALEAGVKTVLQAKNPLPWGCSQEWIACERNKQTNKNYHGQTMRSFKVFLQVSMHFFLPHIHCFILHSKICARVCRWNMTYFSRGTEEKQPMTYGVK